MIGNDLPKKKFYIFGIIKRKFVKSVGRIFIRIFFRFDLIGKENFPPDGPYIMAGNHIGSIEALLMVCFAPELIEIIGAGDIPLDPKLAYFADLYGYIPINRGEIDQKGLKLALGVLEKGGVIGIFPEGGIWDPKIKPAKIGVSWLSSKSNSPIIPIGFVGVKDALRRAFHLKFPRMQMKVGQPIFPNQFNNEHRSQKETLTQASNFVMKQIEALLPESERNIDPLDYKKHDILKIVLVEQISGNETELFFPNLEPLSMLFQHPVIMDVFKRNLKLPIQPLLIRKINLSISELIIAVQSILKLLEEKPGFLPYRFGFETSSEMKAGLENFYEILVINQNKNLSIRID